MQRDGAATVNGNQGGAPNYEPNTQNGPVEDPSKAWKTFPVTGQAGRYDYTHPNNYYEQPRELFTRVMNQTDRDHLISNISGALGGARRDIQEGFLKHLFKIHPDYGNGVAKTLGLPT